MQIRIKFNQLSPLLVVLKWEQAIIIGPAMITNVLSSVVVYLIVLREMTQKMLQQHVLVL